ncbi:hypothetical protein [Mycobacterium sp. D16R24]|uniref:hypothetical protein n=1 Tax=Mycobacterium sp. D16R24 TaxID=1855656 RepID=UPI000993E77E|nr:hypothetical protein [Mycobacterium sp. D16R24]
MTTTGEIWLPLGVDGNDEVAEYTALRDDVPDYLYRSLWTWINGKFGVTLRASGGGGFNVGLARQCERVLKISIADSGAYAASSFTAVKNAVSGSDTMTWRLVDYLVSINYSSVSGASSLNEMLLESGSSWKVGERAGKIGLVKRLPAGVQDGAESTFQRGDAGRRLRAAWEAAYGVNPDPSKAYSLAVKAVEDAAIPVVCPNDRSATLGRVNGQVKSGSWKLPHLREDANSPTHDVLLGMMQTLWVGQHDRHGGPSMAGVPAVTQPEAESAVLLAVTLVGWFTTGKVQP